jgi:hypothetical protein
MLGRRPTSPGAEDAGRRGRQCIQALGCNLAAADRAGSVHAVDEALLGSLDIDERASRLVEECCDLLAFPCDGVAFRIVFVISGDIACGRHDFIEAGRETCCAPNGRGAQFVQSRLAIA